MLPRFTWIVSPWSKWSSAPTESGTLTKAIEDTPKAVDKDITAPTEPQEQNAKDDTLFWEQYVKEADLYDRELVKGLGGDLDALLIFAGLFSAANTAIIIEAYKDLKPDPAESGGTNALLRTLIHTIDNSTAPIVPTFLPPPRAVAVNALFFASLCCSLFAAFGAVLAKQWLNEYERTGDHRVPHDRARQRHAKFLGLQKYRCDLVMQALGTVLQISLFLFFLALANWLWGIHRTVAAVTIIGFAITFAFFFATTILSIYDAASPFATRFSALLREIWQSPKSISPPPAKTATAMTGVVVGMASVNGIDGLNRKLDKNGAADDAGGVEMDGKCVAWVLDNATMFDSVAGMARAAASLPHAVRLSESLYHAKVGSALLRSIIASNAIPLGFANGTLFSTLHTIRDAMTSWRGVPILLACDVVAQLHQMLSLAVPKDPVLSQLIALTLEGVDINMPRDLVPRAQRPEEQTFIELLQLPTLTLEGKRAALSLLWKYYFRERYWEHERQTPPTIQDAASGPLEESWQWKVANALATTATSWTGDDKDAERLEFRVCWAAAYGPISKGWEKTALGDDSALSPLWTKFFGADNFKQYFARRFIFSFHQHAYFSMVVTDFITSSMSREAYERRCHPRASPLRPSGTAEKTPMGCSVLATLELRVLEAAFQCPKYSSCTVTLISSLYVWFHLQQRHAEIPLPAVCFNVEYLGGVVCRFLLEQLSESPGSRLPAEHVKVTVDAIQAYIDLLPPDCSRVTKFTDQGLEAYGLLWEIHEGSYHYKGLAQDGQQLWDCLVSVLVALFPDGMVTLIDRVDWANVKVKILGAGG